MKKPLVELLKLLYLLVAFFLAVGVLLGAKMVFFEVSNTPTKFDAAAWMTACAAVLSALSILRYRRQWLTGPVIGLHGLLFLSGLGAAVFQDRLLPKSPAAQPPIASSPVIPDETPAEKAAHAQRMAASARLHACSTVQGAAGDIIFARLSMMIVQRPIVHSLAGNDASAARASARSGLGKIAEARTTIAETVQKIKDAQLGEGVTPEFLKDLKTFSKVQLKLADVEVRRAKALQAYAETGELQLVLDIVDVDKQLQKSSAAEKDLADTFQRICSGSPARPK